MAQQLTSDQMDEIVDENGALAKRRTIKETFATRVHGSWAGAGMGMLYGAMMGALVGLAGMIAASFTVTTLAGAAAILPAVIGAYALAGSAAGGLIMTAVGAPAGAASNNAKEAERKRLADNPDVALADAAKFRAATKEPQREETLLHHVLPFFSGSKQAFSARNALIFGGLALAAGAAILSLGALPALTALTGGILSHVGASAAAIHIIGAAPVAITMGLTTCALFGASFGFDGATVAANATQFVSDIFSGKKLAFGKDKAPAVEIPAPAPKPPTATPQVTSEEAAKLNEKLSCKDRNFTQTIANQQLQAAPAGITTGA